MPQSRREVPKDAYFRRDTPEEAEISIPVVRELAPAKASREIMNRIPTDDALFTCTICKDVLLRRNIRDHHCKGVAPKPDTQFYDNHCGVVDPLTGTKCTRSLNCKAHSIHMKRALSKRSSSFDHLLKKSMDAKKKRKIEKAEKKIEKKEKVTDECIKLEDIICSRITHHNPIIDRSFCIPEIKFDTLAIRSVFFQPLKIQRYQQDRKVARKNDTLG
ncbi:hypothetical protein NEDG_00282 [Nematocida displodere]|uniref:SCA7 domain-containing protein n=1 Tax=Nematocida displodere TaxID=1805483 RepID=A0A177EIP6_9MICR|nr:hypothetical protein NEDG_00282 [Nematocida displodere]